MAEPENFGGADDPSDFVLMRGMTRGGMTRGAGLTSGLHIRLLPFIGNDYKYLQHYVAFMLRLSVRQWIR